MQQTTGIAGEATGVTVYMDTRRENFIFTCAGSLAAALFLIAGCAREPFETNLAKGQQALREGDPAAAGHLRQAARAKPESATLAFNLGMAELKAGRLSRAAAAFTRAEARCDGSSIDALLGLARVRHLQKRWKAAENAYELALERAGRRPDLLAAMAATEIKKGQPESAITLLSEALSQDPAETVALYNMACLQRDAFQDPGAAIAYFGHFLKLAPGAENEARTKAEASVQMLGNVMPSTSARAEAFILKSRQATRMEESVEFAERAVAEDPLSADALWNLATILKNDSKRVESVYARFYRFFPDDSRIKRVPANIRTDAARELLHEAAAAEAAGNWVAAMTAYRRALATEPQNATLWLRLGNAARSAGDYSLALEAASKAQSLRPDNPDTLYLMGYVYLQQKQVPKAIEHYRRYYRIAPAGAQKESVRQWLKSVEK